MQLRESNLAVAVFHCIVSIVRLFWKCSNPSGSFKQWFVAIVYSMNWTGSICLWWQCSLFFFALRTKPISKSLHKILLMTIIPYMMTRVHWHFKTSAKTDINIKHISICCWKSKQNVHNKWHLFSVCWKVWRRWHRWQISKCLAVGFSRRFQQKNARSKRNKNSWPFFWQKVLKFSQWDKVFGRNNACNGNLHAMKRAF